MSYRPICDTWILARTKLKGGKKYYGAFPAGFLHRARALLGVGIDDPVLHVCGGHVKAYPYAGFGPNDRTLDLDPATEPDFLRDAREALPMRLIDCDRASTTITKPWAAVLIDRPYSPEDATKYVPGPGVLPTANGLLRNSLDVVAVGARVGILDYVWPAPPRDRAKEVAVVAVGTGRNNRARWFTVWEKLA
jgi:hypothetical protein